MSEEQKQPEPLYSDDRIGMFSANMPTAWEARRMYQALIKMRDVYEAELSRLRTALAERGEWQPIGDGTIDMDGDTIDILVINEDRWHMTVTEADDSQAMLIMPPDIRLCRRRPQSAPASAVEATKG